MVCLLDNKVRKCYTTKEANESKIMEGKQYEEDTEGPCVEVKNGEVEKWKLGILCHLLILPTTT